MARAQDNELVGNLAHFLFIGRTLAWDAEFEKKVMALDGAQIRAALKRHLDPSKFTIVKAGDFAGAAKKQARAAGARGQVRLRSGRVFLKHPAARDVTRDMSANVAPDIRENDG